MVGYVQYYGYSYKSKKMIDFTHYPECNAWQVYTDNCIHTTLFLNILLIIIIGIILLFKKLKKYDEAHNV